LKEAAIGTTTGTTAERKPDRVFESSKIGAFIMRNEAELEFAKLPSHSGISPQVVAREIAGTLKEIASDLKSKPASPRLEDLERRLTVLEEKLFGVLLAALPDEEVVTVRTQADRELAPYRSKMPASQIEQLQKQFVH